MSNAMNKKNQIAIQNLQKVDLMTELENFELNAIHGGIGIVTGSIIAGGAILAAGALGTYAGYKSAEYLDNDAP